MRKLLFLSALATFSVAAFADWPNDVKWDQMQLDPAGLAVASHIDYDTPSDGLTADDFLCTEPGYINGIQLAGYSYMGDDYLEKFRVQFYSDVPGVPGQSEGHPGDLLYSYEASAADPSDSLQIGWYDKTPGDQYNIYQINLPKDQWFEQTGSATAPTKYWLSVQGVMVTDGFFDAFYWTLRDGDHHYGDDAAFTSTYFGVAPYAHWGVDTDGYASFFTGTVPEGWSSRDMAYNLSGSAVPEPASLIALGLGALALIRRRK